jgi:hypothetical protein
MFTLSNGIQLKVLQASGRTADRKRISEPVDVMALLGLLAMLVGAYLLFTAPGI